MTLFFTRRALHQGKFTNNASTVTRYAETTDGTGATMSRDTWVTRVLQDAGGGDVLIYVHGFNTSQFRTFRRTELLKSGLKRHGFTGTVIAYDWPSNGRLSDYELDRSDAKRTAEPLLEDGIAPLRAANPGLRVHLLCFSMGAFLTLRAYSDMGDAPGALSWRADEVAFVAADSDASWMHSGAWGAVLMARHARRLTNYYSNKDAVLELSQIRFNKGKARAGRTGLPASIPGNHVDLRATERYSASGKSGLTASHTWYFDDPKVLKDLALTLAGRSDSSMQTRKDGPDGDRLLKP